MPDERDLRTREQWKQGALPTIDDAMLGTVDPRQVGRCVLAVLDVMQNFRPLVQVATLAVLLYIGCRRFKTHAGKILERGRILCDRSRCPEFAAVNLYCVNEFK